MPPLQIQRHTETRESSREEPHCDPTDRHNHHLTRPNPTTLPHARAVISISSPSLPSLWTLRHELPPHASHLRATAGHRHTDTATAYLRCSLSVLVLSLCFFLSSSPAGVSLFSLLRSDARRRRVLAASLACRARSTSSPRSYSYTPTPTMPTARLRYPRPGHMRQVLSLLPHRKADLSVSRPEPRTLHRVFEPIFRSRYLVYHDPLPLGPISPTEYSYAVTPTATTAAASSNQHTLTLPRSDSLTRTLVGPKRYVRATWRARSEAWNDSR